MQIVVISVVRSSYAFLVSQWFVLCVLNIIHVLDLELISVLFHTFI